MNSFLTILLNAAGVPPEKVRALIEAGKAAVPELAPEADKVLAEMETAISDASIANLVAALPTEAREILKGHLNPRDHASDAI